MRLQNDVQQMIVRCVFNSQPTMELLIETACNYYIYMHISSPTVKEWIRQGVLREIEKLIEWHIIYEVEDDGEPMGYYQTDWTEEEINR